MNHLYMIRKSLIILLAGAIIGCGSLPGKKINEPFSGKAYESNNRFFRGTGKGESTQDNIARGKADLEAKSQLAGQVSTTMQQVTDQYLGQTENQAAADVADKFQSLVRQVMNTNIADLRKIGEEKFFNKAEKKYIVYIAYEINKNSMFRFMKKQARVDGKLTERQLEWIDKILDEEIKKTEQEN